MPVQLRFDTGLAGEHYVTRELWRLARLERCPLHPRGGCGFSRHGTYERKSPPGTCVARWYCPQGHQTFSLLPDHLAARFPGTLPEIERVVAAAEHASSVQACADALRPVTISLPSAMRWVRRRLARVRALLAIIVAMVPQHLQGCVPTIHAVHERLVAAPAAGSATPAQGGSAPDGAPGSALVRLRDLLSEHLAALACPLGFRHRHSSAGEHHGGLQQHMGPDPPREAAYVGDLPNPIESEP
ncbi:MAG: hypothetical protein U5L05_07600, partial [Rubrivivax sp.]|nr:hypothetical protein [Rubrivivax sp.]